MGANEVMVEVFAISPFMARSLNSLNASSLGGLIAKTMPMDTNQTTTYIELDSRNIPCSQLSPSASKK